MSCVFVYVATFSHIGRKCAQTDINKMKVKNINALCVRETSLLENTKLILSSRFVSHTPCHTNIPLTHTHSDRAVEEMIYD